MPSEDAFRTSLSLVLHCALFSLGNLVNSRESVKTSFIVIKEVTAHFVVILCSSDTSEFLLRLPTKQITCGNDLSMDWKILTFTYGKATKKVGFFSLKIGKRN